MIKKLCENGISFCAKDGDSFVLINKKSKKEMHKVEITDNPNYALALVAKWGYKLCKGLTEEDLLK